MLPGLSLPHLRHRGWVEFSLPTYCGIPPCRDQDVAPDEGIIDCVLRLGLGKSAASLKKPCYLA